VINEPKKGVSALIWAVNEVQRRLKYLEECQVSDIDKYNEKYKNDPDKEHMPYLLIVISELSELMIDYSSEVEKCLSRLAPLSRAAGIHLILATQRPTSDVITSNVYNNIGSRIAFAVKEATTSNVILHEHGAEKLFGHGDMLYFPIIHNAEGNCVFFPAVFNIADSFITVAVFLIILFYRKDFDQSLNQLFPSKVKE
jgi:S-DNA-T family DNA segregation ATPase FtsK/SpoIIIE